MLIATLCLLIQDGPITVHEYMQLCVSGAAGYYSGGSKNIRDRNFEQKKIFGAHGDFVTSPEISQLFGEMIGIWIALELENTGHKGEWQLVELGPGSGLLMRDILTVFKNLKLSNFDVHFVEKSDYLENEQRNNICSQHSNKKKGGGYRTFSGLRAYWHKWLDNVPDDKFTVFIANEFFDALPIHQFQRNVGTGEWCEVLVGLEHENRKNLCFTRSIGENLHTRGLIPSHIRENTSRIQWEVCKMGAEMLGKIIHRFTTFGGFSLVVDYGHDGDRMTPSLRAYRRHEQLANILEEPGCVDITADVDFGEWKSLFEGQCLMFGPVAQRDFLMEMGILYRLQYLLKRCKTDKQREYLYRSFEMLIGSNIEDENILRQDSTTLMKNGWHGMGKAFKVFALFPSTLGTIMEKRGGVPLGFGTYNFPRNRK